MAQRKTKAQKAAPKETKQEACPRCGYCPHCGRSDHRPPAIPAPWLVPRPYRPYPFWGEIRSEGGNQSFKGDTTISYGITT